MGQIRPRQTKRDIPKGKLHKSGKRAESRAGRCDEVCSLSMKFLDTYWEKTYTNTNS